MVNLSVYSAVLCAIVLTCFLGGCACGGSNVTHAPACCNNYNYCKDKCPKYTGVYVVASALYRAANPTNFFISVDGGNLIFSIYGSLEGSTSVITFTTLLAIFYKYNNRYYYIQFNGETQDGCSESRQFLNTNAAQVTSLWSPNYKINDILNKMSQPYASSCTIFTNTNYRIPDDVDGFYQLYSNRWNSFQSCEDKTMSNSNYSVTQQTAQQYGVSNRVVAGQSSVDNGSPYRCQYFTEVDNSCGTPTNCPQDSVVPPFTTIIQSVPGCYAQCLTPGNPAAAETFAQCLCRGSQNYVAGAYIRSDFVTESPDAKTGYLRTAAYVPRAFIDSILAIVCRQY